MKDIKYFKNNLDSKLKTKIFAVELSIKDIQENFLKNYILKAKRNYIQ